MIPRPEHPKKADVKMMMKPNSDGLVQLGAVDAHTGESFFIIAGGCNTDWKNEFLRQLSQSYPNDDILLVMDNTAWHKSQTLEKRLCVHSSLYT